MNYTITDKLAVVEAMIEAHRWSPTALTEAEWHSFDVLKAIATDYRGRVPGAPGETIKALDRRVKAYRSALDDTSRISRVAALGADVVARWTTIRQALERFETALEAAE